MPTRRSNGLVKYLGSRWFSTVWPKLKPWLKRLLITFGVILVAAVVYLDITIRKQFEGGSWAIPAHVYTRPLDLYVGLSIAESNVLDELGELGYRPQTGAPAPGTFESSGGGITIYAREFQFWDQLRLASRVRIGFNPARTQITSVTSLDEKLGLFQLEGRLFGSVSPLSHEDRELLTLEQIPEGLITALVSIEDRNFFSHWGISPIGILRAAVANLVQGRVVQGGSTLTQQLVKNYYLTAERTISRKLVELVMAILLEFHYSKHELLLAYINEVYLGQAGNRAIHGFGLGSQFLFGRPLQELNAAELATLAGMVKGPNYYNPLRHPERALERRNLVLEVMRQEGLISDVQAGQLQQMPLGTGGTAARQRRSYPDFLDLVRQQLRKDYQDNALSDAGLRIYTTLNPRIQNSVENTISSRLAQIEKSRSIDKGTLEAAAIVLRTDSGEVVALAGGRDRGFAGYNRVLDAIRPVGSLLKPFVYLGALEQPEKYGLGTLIADKSITVSQVGSEDWTPQNYNGEEHGLVTLIDALKHSYNLATVNLGMGVGLDTFSQLLQRFKYNAREPIYPSAFLGAVPMTVIEVADLYLTLANSGFKTPTKSVRSVLSDSGDPLGRYPLSIEQVAKPESIALIVHAMQQVVEDGTANAIGARFGRELGYAGKTGTSDGYRDSWYAGFSGEHLMVVWVGRDDNQPTGLSGATAAAHIWSDTIAKINTRSLKSTLLADMTMVSIDPATGMQIEGGCPNAEELPYIVGYEPMSQSACYVGGKTESISNNNSSGAKARKSVGDWLKGIFK